MEEEGTRRGVLVLALVCVIRRGQSDCCDNQILESRTAHGESALGTCFTAEVSLIPHGSVRHD